MRAKGFTLIEVVLVIAIMSVISVVVGQVLFQSFKTFQTSQEILNAQYQGWLGIQRISEDIHTIRSASDITTIDANNLVFTDVNGVSVAYALSGSTLTRSGNTLATGITGLTFSYLNATGATTSTPSLVRYINVSTTAVQGTASTSFSTMVAVRI